VAGKKILLLLDDAAGHEQVRPLLPGTAGSLVLITSRRRLAALDDATVISLDTLSRGEAAALLVRLAARPGMSAGDVAVGEVTRLCGYLPLAIGMIASQLRHHPAWTAAELAADLAAARDRLGLMRAENVSVGAAFDLSYQDLTAEQQRLFRRLGLIPGPDFDAYAAAALDGASLGTARRDLGELYDQHLLAEPAPGRYRLHDLLREHARALAIAADDDAETGAAAGRLLDYYLHTALAAGRHSGSWVSANRRLRPGRPPAYAPDVSTLRPAGAWLEAERVNLHAAADYAAGQARSLYAIAIPAAMGGFLAARGHWDQFAALHQTALAAARQAGDQLGEAYTLAELGLLRREAGDYPAAAASHQQALALFCDLGSLLGQAEALNRLGELSSRTSATSQACERHTQALAITRDISAPLEEARALEGIGQCHIQNDDLGNGAAYLRQALAIYQRIGAPHTRRLQETLAQPGQLANQPDHGPSRPSHPPLHRR
jgi:tetratricopeptide (TPR) repeat protein